MAAHQIKGTQSHNDVARTIWSLTAIGGHKTLTEPELLALREVRANIRAAAKNEAHADQALVVQIGAMLN